MSELDEIVAEFLVESYENLDRYDQDLLELERDPTGVEVLSSIFRTIHTVKGTCGFFGFGRLESVAHVAENLLGRLREGELAVTGEIATALLETGDAIRSMLADIEATGAEGASEHADLVATLERLHAGEPTTVADSTDDAPATAVDTQPESDEVTRLGSMLVEQGATEPVEVDLALHRQELGDERPIGEILVEEAEVPPAEVDAALASQATARSVSDSSIRVDVGMLDELMNLVGELVLARNQIVQLVTEEEDSAFATASQRLNLITTELQEGVMKTRMQPIGNIWNKLPRVVRDLSLACGKSIDLVMEGQDTELDKTIIEAIKDPLTHLVRNAVDHGIETAEARVAAGKSATGRLVLRAFHEGGQVNIEIADDGGGIDAAKVAAKAVERGLLTAAQAAEMSDREAVQLIFAPGFSTAEAVTNVSGRGVGMDVVRTNIERIGGAVDVQTDIGTGSTFKVKIPLTLAIIPALVVTSDGDRYAIPQLSLLELVRLEGQDARSGIEMIQGTPVYRLRGRLLPIVGLRHELGQPVLPTQGVTNIVVLQADGHQFGLIVDHINDTQEIVVKPLGSRLKDTTLFAGATIMGDGRVALILDVLGIAERARVVSATRDRAAFLDDADEVATGVERRSLLLVGLGGGDGADVRRAAIDLAQVARLEEFPRATLEMADGREVVQYRGEILPLVRLADELGVHAWGDAEGPLTVVVHHHEGADVGVIVGEILDIVEEHLELGVGAGGGSGRVLGSAVIQGRVTDVVDTAAIVAAALPPADAYADATASFGG